MTSTKQEELLPQPDLALARSYYHRQRRVRLLAGLFALAALLAIPLCLRISVNFWQQVVSVLQQPRPAANIVADLVGATLLALGGTLLGEIVLFSALTVLFSQAGRLYQAEALLASPPRQVDEEIQFYIYVAGRRLSLRQRERANLRLVLGQEFWLLLALHQRHGRVRWQATGAPARQPLSPDQLAQVPTYLQNWDNGAVQKEIKRFRSHWIWRLCYWLCIILLLAMPVLVGLAS